jgi:hypothetical protein
MRYAQGDVELLLRIQKQKCERASVGFLQKNWRVQFSHQGNPQLPEEPFEADQSDMGV